MSLIRFWIGNDKTFDRIQRQYNYVIKIWYNCSAIGLSQIMEVLIPFPSYPGIACINAHYSSET